MGYQAETPFELFVGDLVHVILLAKEVYDVEKMSPTAERSIGAHRANAYQNNSYD